MKIALPKIEEVLLLGGGRVFFDIAKILIDRKIKVSVITSPRHFSEKVDDETTLREFLENKGLDFLVAEKINSEESLSFISKKRKPLFLSVGAAWIFRKDILDSVFDGKLLNLHGSRLPQNRGGGNFSWFSMMATRLGFCQLHLVDPGVDTGDIIKTEEFIYPPSCRRPIDYECFYREKNSTFVANFVDSLLEKEMSLETMKQPEYLSTYWPRLKTDLNGWIDWREEAHFLERFICSFDEPYSGAMTTLRGKKVHIKNVCLDYSDSIFHPYQSGIIYRTNKDWINVAANGGNIIIQSVTDSEGNDITGEIKAGDRFVTRYQDIEDRVKRIVYTASGVVSKK